MCRATFRACSISCGIARGRPSHWSGSPSTVVRTAASPASATCSPGTSPSTGSARRLYVHSQGGAYVHNLVASGIISTPDKRVTPYHLAHSTEIGGTSNISAGDNRFCNNIFIGYEEQKRGLSVYDNKELPLRTGGNVYLNGAKPYAKEINALVPAGIDPGLRRVEKHGRMVIQCDGFPELDNARITLVTTALLRRARIQELAFVNPDGSALAVDPDSLGKPRSQEQPSPGPFEKPGRGPIS